ncbi:MAG: VOC family protein [Acidimicrobiales bacterium]|nr:VOC family protein [Acidimicrobiales bacterium]
MAIKRMNHAVLYVRDARRSADFYRDVLGFRTVAEMPGGAFLQAPDSTNDHDIAFFTIGAGAGPSAAGRSTVGLYHLAWEVGTLRDLVEVRRALADAGALVGESDHGTTKSLYAHDPDGLEFEVCWVIPADLLTGDEVMTTTRLDLDAELARYGADTVGGR